MLNININKDVSAHCFKVFGEARRIALALGYDYISTFHLFLGDCIIRRSDSLYDFAFTSEDNFQEVIDSYRIGEPLYFEMSVPLNVEAEHALRSGIKLWKKEVYPNKKLQPYHIFFAAFKDEKSSLYGFCKPNENLFQRVEEYYVIQKGVKKRESKRRRSDKK